MSTRIRLLYHGSISTPISAVYSDAADHEQNDKIELPVSSLLIQTGDSYLLYDTGMSPNLYGENGFLIDYKQKRFPFISKGVTADYTPVEDLQKIGIGCDEIKTVVLSHMHFDHAGCIGFFPNAEFYVGEQEMQEVLKDYISMRNDRFVWGDANTWIKMGLCWHLVDENTAELDLNDDIKLLSFGSGHSYSMIALQIRLRRSGTVLAVSDCCYTRRAYDHIIPPGTIRDKEGWLSTIRRLKEIQRRENATVIFGHDLEQFKELHSQGWIE